ncbi:unnamed protein product, partial [Eretmochelys imbricata]
CPAGVAAIQPQSTHGVAPLPEEGECEVSAQSLLGPSLQVPGGCSRKGRSKREAAGNTNRPNPRRPRAQDHPETAALPSGGVARSESHALNLPSEPGSRLNGNATRTQRLASRMDAPCQDGRRPAGRRAPGGHAETPAMAAQASRNRPPWGGAVSGP